MKKAILLTTSLCLVVSFLFAQDKEEEEKKGFKKENLFTGGSISLAFYNNTFLVGGNPVFGYNLGNWGDLGLVGNYTYTSYRDFDGIFDNKLRQSIYGGGLFLKLYPVRFLFVQAQPEHNWIKLKGISPSGFVQRASIDGNSFLIGGGYTTGRYGKGGSPYFYLAILFDVSGNENSPYTDSYGRTIPIIRGGIQVPLFQGQSHPGSYQGRSRNHD